jgi:hypothetical protein
MKRFWKWFLYRRLKRAKCKGWVTTYHSRDSYCVVTVASHEQEFVLWKDVERAVGVSK